MTNGFDLRETPFDGVVAHVSLQGKVDAERFVEGERRYVSWPPVLNLWRAPGKQKDRELLFGEAFCVLDEDKSFAYGFAEKDGYCGYVEAHALIEGPAPTHRVSARMSYGLGAPDFKTSTEHVPLVHGAHIHVVGGDDTWTEFTVGDLHRFVPTRHIQPIDERADDPAGVAELLLGTPYVWGGNSAYGIDCSGLMQAALLACGIPCPGDSDQQEARVGSLLGPDDPLQRGDLVFWKGHVAMALDAQTIIHANAHHMAVAVEPLATARARIAASGGGPVTSTRRP